MVSQEVEVKNGTGLHARPASAFVKIANSQDCNVYVEKDGKRVTGKSILRILTLSIKKGEFIKIIAEGQGEKEALQELVQYVEELREYM